MVWVSHYIESFRSTNRFRTLRAFEGSQEHLSLAIPLFLGFLPLESYPLWFWGMGVATPTNRLRTSRAFQRAQEHLPSLSGSRDSHTPYFWVFASYPLWVLGMGVATPTNRLRTLRAFQRAPESRKSLFPTSHQVMGTSGQYLLCECTCTPF